MTDLTEQWINIYKSKKHGSYWTGAFCYKTKEEAVKDLADKENYLTTVNIEDMLNLQTQNAQLKEKIERLEKQLNIAIGVLSQYTEAPTRNLARCALDRIAEIDGDYSHYWEQQIKELGNVSIRLK